jgi:hypothetical protein
LGKKRPGWDPVGGEEGEEEGGRPAATRSNTRAWYAVSGIQTNMSKAVGFLLARGASRPGGLAAAASRWRWCSSSASSSEFADDAAAVTVASNSHTAAPSPSPHHANGRAHLNAWRWGSRTASTPVSGGGGLGGGGRLRFAQTAAAAMPAKEEVRVLSAELFLTNCLCFFFFADTSPF